MEVVGASHPCTGHTEWASGWLFSLVSLVPPSHHPQCQSCCCVSSVKHRGKVKKNQFLHTFPGLKKNPPIPVSPLVAVGISFPRSAVLWGVAGGHGWPYVRHLKPQRNNVTASASHTVVRTATLGQEPGLEFRTLVAFVCCSCLPWQISSPARMVWLLQDLDFHFNNPKPSLDSAKELNLNTKPTFYLDIFFRRQGEKEIEKGKRGARYLSLPITRAKSSFSLERFVQSLSGEV